MRKCHLNSADYQKKLNETVTSVNGRSRYEHKLWLERQGIKPNSKESFKYTRAKTSYQESDIDSDIDFSVPTKAKKKVTFTSSRSCSPLPNLSINTDSAASTQIPPSTNPINASPISTNLTSTTTTTNIARSPQLSMTICGKSSIAITKLGREE